MIARLSKRIASFFVCNEVIKSEDEEVYEYGLQLLLSTVFNGVIALTLAIISGTVLQCVCYLAVFVLLRKSAGGYHAKTHFGCCCILAVVLSLFIMFIKFVPNEAYGIVATITQMMQPLMGMSPYVFIVCALAIAVFMTHFATNMVLCIVFMPFMVTFASTVGMNPTGIVALLFFSCQMSLATPGGGAPLSAMFYGMDEWVQPGMMSKMAIIMILFLFAGDMIFGLLWSNVIF